MYSNDRSAPRMRKGQFSKSIVTRELWMAFRRDFPEYKKMSWEQFSKTWDEISTTIRQEAITNPLGVKLGSYTGEIKLQYLFSGFKGIDRHLSSELKEETNHLNLLSRGKIAVIKWERRWAVKFNKMLQFFAFSPTRELNRMAKVHTDKNPEKLRSTRNTLGGYSIWRQLKYKK